MIGQRTHTSSRIYQVEVPIMQAVRYSGEIIQFNTEFIELRYRRHGSSKYDVILVHLADPRIRLIFGDPSGGPGMIVLQDDLPVSYNDGRDPIKGVLSEGPHGLVKVSRNSGPPVWIKAGYMNAIVEDAAAGQNTAAEQRRRLARGELWDEWKTASAPTPRGKTPKTGKGRPPVNSPAATEASSDWS